MPQKHKIRHVGPSKPAMCASKRRYRTRAEAEVVKAEHEILTPDLELSIYRCLTCGDFHLTRRKELLY